jgi:uncharacterized Zn-finger protein
MSDNAPANTASTIQVHQASFACEGGGDDLGHPKVQLTLDKSGQRDCPYCGLHFELAEGASADSSH